MRNKVSVPSFGDSFFIKDMLEDEAISLEKVFPSPYSGILFLSERKVILCYQNSNCFRPLIRGFFFYGYEMYELSGNRYSFRPLIRGFFFYGGKISLQYRNVAMVSVPSFGDSFFINIIAGILKMLTISFPSPHSGILFLSDSEWLTEKVNQVSVPSFGDSFFMQSRGSRKGWRDTLVSVPSFGDSFFIVICACIITVVNCKVSVPSFGDSFFIQKQKKMRQKRLYRGFPSPHSGILFLLNSSPVNGFSAGFRPLIRGFFFYEKGGEQE